MDILVDDIMRYEELSEQSELYALTAALAGAPSNTQTVHEMGVLIFFLHYVLVQTLKCRMCLRQPPLHIACIGCILL